VSEGLKKLLRISKEAHNKRTRSRWAVCKNYCELQPLFFFSGLEIFRKMEIGRMKQIKQNSTHRYRIT